MSEQSAQNDAQSLRAELAEALAADLNDRPQRCGHSSDPMCCPYENFPALAEFFTAPVSVIPPASGEHHPNCYQSTGVPDGLPAGLCDCRVLRMIESEREAER